ncbi:MAG: AtpZ/AtpI family protein [Candidatus Magasanikbacteria bacterium]|jgi:hypothetical protein|nr:AtpZ/AtpI family protein [Candidatus Magasanikbacteria bacterium]
MSELDKVRAKKEALMHKTFIMMLQVVVVFGVPAFVAYFAGAYLDQTYDMRPFGSIAMGGLGFITSWVIIIQMYRKLAKDFRALDAREDELLNEKK